MVKKLLVMSLCLVALAAASTAVAYPTLQIYLEGATYDTGTETWVLNSSGGTARLWVIAQGDVRDVNLAAAVLTSEVGSGSISITGSNTGGLGGFGDPSDASDPTLSFLSADGQVPQLSSGGFIGPHGIYQSGTSFFQYALGDMNLDDSPIADFITGFPAPSGTMGTINVYDVTVSGFSRVHFDAYNHVEGAKHATFAPFSHDGEAGGGGNGGQASEPASLLLLGGGLLGAIAARRKK